MSNNQGMKMDTEDLKRRIADLIEMEARSGSMDPALITPEYVFRMFGGTVPLEEIREVIKLLSSQKHI